VDVGRSVRVGEDGYLRVRKLINYLAGRLDASVVWEVNIHEHNFGHLMRKMIESLLHRTRDSDDLNVLRPMGEETADAVCDRKVIINYQDFYSLTVTWPAEVPRCPNQEQEQNPHHCFSLEFVDPPWVTQLLPHTVFSVSSQKGRLGRRRWQ
jgi:hypothetical protein